VTLDDPRVFVDTLTHPDGRTFVWFVSQHPEEVEVTPKVEGALRRLDGGPAVRSVALPAYGVAVLELD
jgi:beta-glucosidase